VGHFPCTPNTRPRGGAARVPLGVSRFRLWKRSRGRIATKRSTIWNTDCRRNSFRSHLLTAWAHGDATTCTRGGGPRLERPDTAPLSSELRHHTAYPAQSEAGSHLGSTLNPGGAVLTLGVSRRSRSVACIRADASPSEVLAEAMVAPGSRSVKLTAARLHQFCRYPAAGGRGITVTRKP